jgi:hypothetical protein
MSEVQPQALSGLPQLVKLTLLRRAQPCSEQHQGADISVLSPAYLAAL